MHTVLEGTPLVRGVPSWPVCGVGEGGGSSSPPPHTGQEGFEPSWPVCGEVEAILNTIDHLEQPFHCNQHALIKEGRNVINNRGG